MQPKFIWIPNDSACDICLRMSTRTYNERPARPHPRCMCSIVQVYDGSSAGKCVFDGIRIQRVELVSHDADIENKKVKALYHEYNVTAICRDNTFVEVNVQIELSGTTLKNIYEAINAVDFDTGERMAEQEAVNQAMDEIEAVCPGCTLNQS